MTDPTAVASVQDVSPLEPALRPLLLPEISAKLALGAKSKREADEVIVAFEGDFVSLHREDFALAQRVSERVRAKLPERLSPGAVIQAVLLAQQFMSEELFRPGAVRVLFYATLSKASAFYRCVMPQHALAQGSRCVAHATAGKFTRAAFEYDVVVFQIDHSPGAFQFAKALKDAGKKIIFELDDAFDCLEPWHPSYAVFGLPERQASIAAMMGLADAVQVSTPWLVDRYREFAKRIEVVPNMLELSTWPRAPRLRKDGLFRILWAGSESHKGDLDEVVPALAQFARAHEDVRVILFGQKLRDTGIPSDQLEEIPWCDFGEYPFKFAEVDADVMVAPLAPIPFNLGKSNLRVLQGWATGYTTIASKVGSYAQTIEHGADGLLVSTERDWLDALTLLRSDRKKAEKLARNGFESVKRWDVCPNISRIESFYTSVAGRGRE